MSTEDNLPPRDTWKGMDDSSLNTPKRPDSAQLASTSVNNEYPQPGDVSGDQPKPYREKQIKPNKVYIGGLPEHTRQEDLQSCFGKIGSIVNIELKVGYGFVEFDSREAAEESVAKYHEGYFMGNKIRVELSHGGGRTAKYAGDPGACFRCGQMGHWARECPNSGSGGGRRHNEPIADRMQSREYLPPRDYPARDDYARAPPPRERYGYDYPPPRDYGRRPQSPGRDYPPAPPRSTRDFDDYRRPPPAPAPPASSRYESRPYPSDDIPYPPRSYGGPPPRGGYGGPPGPPVRDPYDRYDRRPPPANDRYAAYPPQGMRPRTPPAMSMARSRDDYSSRDYPPPNDYRGRPVSPPRYGEYPRSSSPDRYRRRSASPARSSMPPTAYDPGYSNGYSGGGSSSVLPLSAGPMRTGGSRDYAPRNGRDSGDAGYRRS